VMLNDPMMQKKAAEALDQLASEPSGKAKTFIDFQKEWVKTHKVYSGFQAFK
jgi:hypothetical protein